MVVMVHLWHTRCFIHSRRVYDPPQCHRLSLTRGSLHVLFNVTVITIVRSVNASKSEL